MFKRLALGLILAILLAVGAGVTTQPEETAMAAPRSQVSGVRINEMQISTTGSDYEFIELVGAPGTDLSSLTILGIDSDNGVLGTPDEAFTFTSESIPADGYFVATNSNADSEYGITGDFSLPSNAFENSSATYLLVENYIAGTSDFDTNDDGTLDVTAWTAIIDSVAFTDGDSGDLFYEGAEVVGPDGSFLPSGAFRCANETGTFSGKLLDFSGTDGTPGVANPCTRTPTVVINELRTDQSGDDDDEYFELFGTANASLDGFSYLVIGDGSGGSGVIEAVVDLTGQTIPNDGFFVAAESTYTLGNRDFETSLNFENSDNVTHLLVQDFNGSNGDDLDTDDNGTIDVTPWASVVDAIGLIESASVPPSGTEYVYGTELGFTDIGPDGSFVPAQVFRCPDGETGTWNIGAFTLGANDTPGAANDCPTPVIVINEIMQNPAAVSDSVGEWVELYNPGLSPVDIDGWTIKDNGSDSHTINNGGPLEIPAEGYLVLGNNADDPTNGGVTVAYQYSNFNLGNSDDEVILEDGSGTEVDRVEYDGGPNFPDPSGASMQLDDPTNDNNVGANWCEASNATFGDGDFGTPNAANDCPTAPPSVVKIHEVQGSGAAIPPAVDGTIVAVQGIVVGDYQEDDQLDGFFLQEETADEDGNMDTSEGIFVFCDSDCLTNFPDVAEGDLVTVVGEAVEFFDMSQIDATASGGSITLDGDASNSDAGTGLSLVTPVQITLPIPPEFASINDFYERYEGMLVEFTEALIVTEYFELGRYGQVVLADESRPFQYTQDPANVPFNSTDYNNFLDDVERSTIILDDDNNTQNAILGGSQGDNPAEDTAIYHPIPGTPTGFDVNNYFRGGSTVSTPGFGSNLVGVLHWSWAGQGGTDAWRIRPLITNPVDFDNTPTPRPAAPTITGNVSVAAFNVLNYFNGDGAGGGFPTSRGADSQAEFDRQTDKIVAAINALDADVVGLIEIENEADNPADGITSATEDLVIALNADAGAGTWEYVVTPVAVGTDEIKQAIIYKPAIVSPVGAVQVVDDTAFVEPRTPGDPKNRPAVVQTFEVVETGNPDLGAQFTVIVNHLKSKGSGCGAGDDDTTGQGNCNGTRTDAMNYLINTWLPANGYGPNNNVLIIGDINAYYAEDPMQVAYDAGYVNVLPPTQYTYVFDGQLGSLDHILVSPGLQGTVESAAPWNINADEVNVLDYNDAIDNSGESWFERKTTVNDLYDPDEFRSSDHDPVIVGLDLPIPALTVSAQSGTLAEGSSDTASYDLSLTTVPSNGTVVVDITTDGQCSVSPQQLTFSDTSAQTVTVSVVDDDILEANLHTCDITNTANATSSPEYIAKEAMLSVDITDDDAPPSNTNFLVNGDFSAGRPPWVLFGDFQFALDNGVMTFYREFPGWQGAQLFQNVDQPFAQNTPLEVTVDLGNTSNVPKGIELRLRNQAWTDVISCSVTIPPNTPLTTVTMQGLTSQPWDDFNFTLDAYDNDNTAAVLVDNAAIRYEPTAGITGLDCAGFDPPTNENLLRNGDFSNGRFYWTLWGDFQFLVNTTDELLEFYRQSGATRLANLFTEGAHYIPENAPIRLTIDIGNSSNIAKDISIILRDPSWSQIFNCTYTVAPNTPLTTVTVQGVTNQMWSNPFVMVRALNADGAAAIRVDNASVQYLPGATITNQCDSPLNPASVVAEPGVYEAEDTDNAIEREGLWVPQQNAAASAQAFVTNVTEDSALQLEFVGTSVDIIYTATPESGTLVIEVDGAVRRTVPTTTESVQHGQVASINYLQNTTHLLRIYSIDGPVAIDAIRIE